MPRYFNEVQLLPGQVKVALGEFVGSVTQSELSRLGLRVGLTDEQLRHVGGNKVDQAMGMIRVVEKMVNDQEMNIDEAKGIIGQMFHVALEYRGLKPEDRPQLAENLARAGIFFESQHPGAVLAQIAVDESENRQLERAYDLARSALLQFATNPQHSVTTATSFAETACKEALRAAGLAFDGMDLPKLMQAIRGGTNFESKFGVTEKGKGVVQAFMHLMHTSYALAHDVGDRHTGPDEDAGNPVRWLQVSAAMALGHAVMSMIGKLEARAQPAPAAPPRR